MTNEERIELCLKRLSMGKTSDVVNFSYAGTLEYIERLKAENAALKGRLSNSIELPCPLGVQMYVNFPFVGGERTIDGVFDGVKIGFDSDGTEKLCAIMRVNSSSVYDDDDDDEDEGGEDYFYFPLDHFNKTWWIEKQDALAELRKRTEGERE